MSIWKVFIWVPLVWVAPSWIPLGIKTKHLGIGRHPSLDWTLTSKVWIPLIWVPQTGYPGLGIPWYEDQTHWWDRPPGMPWLDSDFYRPGYCPPNFIPPLPTTWTAETNAIRAQKWNIFRNWNSISSRLFWSNESSWFFSIIKYKWDGY